MIKADMKMLMGERRAVMRFDSAFSQFKPDINYTRTIYTLYITTAYRFINGEGGNMGVFIIL